MAMSLGKSSSMAAVLLVVALVAGTCASGAQAEFDFTLFSSGVCRDPVVIRSQSADFNSTLAPNRSVHVKKPPSVFFQGLVTITLATEGIQPIDIPETKSATLKKLPGVLQKIEIKCDGETNCIKLKATFKTPRGRRFLRLPGRFCPNT